MPRPSIRRAGSTAIRKYLHDFKRGSSKKVPQIAEVRGSPIPESPVAVDIPEDVVQLGSDADSLVETDVSPFTGAVVSAMRRL